MEAQYDYLEVIVLHKTVYENTVFEYNIGKDRFYALLNKMKQSPMTKEFKFFQNDYVETRHGQLQRMQYYQGGKLVETKIYDVKPVLVSSHEDHIKVYYQRQKVPDVMFPSTLTYDSIRKFRRLIFRVNNRLFLNFQIEKNQDISPNNECYKVFVNFNNARDADNSQVQKTIDAIMQLLR